MMVALAACGADTSGPGPSTSPATPGPSATSPAPSPSPSTYLPSPEPDFTVPVTPLGRLERLTGVITDGVESGCRLLTIESAAGATTPGSPRQVVLLSDDGRLTAGTRVTIEGHRSEKTATTCQQGVPFQVTRVLDVRAQW